MMSRHGHARTPICVVSAAELRQMFNNHDLLGRLNAVS
jgi:hypothetical protein